MNHVFWLQQNSVCGRPGPNLVPWDINELWNGGVRAILSVNDGALVHRDDVIGVGMHYQCTPLSDEAPPRPGDLELCLARLPEAFEFVSRNVARDRVTLVHCRQGRDRTGLFMAYYVSKRFDVAPEEAVTQVKRVRPDALSANGWDRFALEVLRAS